LQITVIEFKKLTKPKFLGINELEKFYEIYFQCNQHYYQKGLCSLRAEAKGKSLLKRVPSQRTTWDFSIWDLGFGIWDFFVDKCYI